jgi:hypothetical protein
MLMVGQRMKQQENVSFRLKNIMPGTKKIREEHLFPWKTTIFPQEKKVRLGIFLHLA